MRGFVLAGAILVGAVGCGDGGRSSGGSSTGGGAAGGPVMSACAPGERELADGGCLAAGDTETGCAPGERLVDGVCQAAGIPPGGCGMGFVHDGDVGCDPVLPEAACTAGTFALPGERSCHGFDDCGSAPYPTVPAGETVVHADANYQPGNGDGSAAAPFRTLQEAVDAAPDGAVIAIAAGSYESVLVDRPLTLWGRCGDMVSVEANGGPAIALDGAASGSTVRDLAVTGDDVGLQIVDATAVALERLWIHDTAGRGVNVLHETQPAAVGMTDLLIEAASERAIYAEGSALTIERVAIRDTQPLPAGSSARAINLRDDPETQTGGEATIRACVVEGGMEGGVLIHASSATIEDSVVRGVAPTSAGRFGRAINVQTDSTSTAPASLSLRTSLVSGCFDGGVVASGATLEVDRVVVRDIAHNLDEQLRGYGVAAQYNPSSGLSSALTLRDSLIERTREAGVFVTGSEVSMEGVVIRHVEHVEPLDPNLPELLGGRALTVQHDAQSGQPATASLLGVRLSFNEETAIVFEGATAIVESCWIHDTKSLGANFGRAINAEVDEGDATPSSVTVRQSLIERNAEVGVFVMGSAVTLESVLLRDMQPRPDDDLGVGVDVEVSPQTGVRGTLEVRDSVIRDVFVAGAMAYGGDLMVVHSLVDGVEPSGAFGDFGDGVAVVGLGAPATGALSGSRIANVARAGAANFGADFTVERSNIECAAIDLDAEPLFGVDGVFHDLGMNDCGCGAEQQDCKVLSAMIAPPDPPPTM
jgi:hypothetical protein